MTVVYRLTEQAENELGEILQYVAQKDGVERALNVHGKFLGAFEHLAAMPNAGSRRMALTGDQVRWWTVFKWVVIYDPGTPITILRVIHGAREFDRILRPDP